MDRHPRASRLSVAKSSLFRRVAVAQLSRGWRIAVTHMARDCRFVGAFLSLDLCHWRKLPDDVVNFGLSRRRDIYCHMSRTKEDAVSLVCRRSDVLDCDKGTHHVLKRLDRLCQVR